MWLGKDYVHQHHVSQQFSHMAPVLCKPKEYLLVMPVLDVGLTM
jgi:hypothetical protein